MTGAGGSEAAGLSHRPVMLEETLAALAPRDGAVYVDATFGGGGYASAILAAAACVVIGVDRDPAACARGRALAAEYAGRLVILHGRFSRLAALLESAGFSGVDGVAFDLGVSSHQIDDPARGFSFRFDGPLDMRMDAGSDATEPAADLVNRLSRDEIARILADYGEERAARRIAAAIVKARATAPIVTTAALAELVRRIIPQRASDAIDPATRTFQALRIAVNDELAEIEGGLAAAERALNPGGRLSVVSFHSLEDRVVKTFLRDRSGGAPLPSRHQPDAPAGPAPTFRLLTRRAAKPGAAELAANPRARSARLRAAERTAAPPWPELPRERRAA